ncbi:MAG: 5'-nucleotidase [Spirochaetaceae bacterium]|nr:5'-nucleotidase [Spirochaetaceae bacterium]MDT8297103.1 5'-nucleotidase [Spirochaetaceae bacterium]
MPPDLTDTLVIGISSRALFDLERENKIFEQEGLDAYARYQTDNESRVLEPGTAFALVEAFLKLNEKLGEHLVEVVIMSQNNPQTGLRVMNSIDFYNLGITRAAFSGGQSLGPYLEAYCVDLYLSKNPEDVQEAVDHGIAAAQLYAPPEAFNPEADEIRIAFDGDAVLFSEESEIIYKQQGLDAFLEHEKIFADLPLPEGPFGRVLKTLSRIKSLSAEPLVRIALVTARDRPAHERVILTLRSWGVTVDEAYFLGGLSKNQVLKAFNAHIFFDDQDKHAGPASEHVPSARVPYRTTSELFDKDAPGPDSRNQE